jgi:hypothetical protein
MARSNKKRVVVIIIIITIITAAAAAATATAASVKLALSGSQNIHTDKAFEPVTNIRFLHIDLVERSLLSPFTACASEISPIPLKPFFPNSTLSLLSALFIIRRLYLAGVYFPSMVRFQDETIVMTFHLLLSTFKYSVSLPFRKRIESLKDAFFFRMGFVLLPRRPSESRLIYSHVSNHWRH